MITIENAVARWAARAIELGPGSLRSPWVVGPSNTLAITELEEAEENVELAVLSAMEHGKSPDIELAARAEPAVLTRKPPSAPGRERPVGTRATGAALFGGGRRGRLDTAPMARVTGR